MILHRSSLEKKSIFSFHWFYNSIGIKNFKKEELGDQHIKLFEFGKKEKKKAINQRFFNLFEILKTNPNVFEIIKISFKESLKLIRTNLNLIGISVENVEKCFSEIFKRMRSIGFKK